jgi:hypothetical protein
MGASLLSDMLNCTAQGFCGTHALVLRVLVCGTSLSRSLDSVAG